MREGPPTNKRPTSSVEKAGLSEQITQHGEQRQSLLKLRLMMDELAQDRSLSERDRANLEVIKHEFLKRSDAETDKLDALYGQRARAND